MLDPPAWPPGGRGGWGADLPWGAMSGQVTRFLTEWRAGDPQAVERLVAVLYDELRALDLSTRSVQRSWTTARAWLRKELGGHAAATP
jgi:hypothetical protein